MASKDADRRRSMDALDLAPSQHTEKMQARSPGATEASSPALAPSMRASSVRWPGLLLLRSLGVGAARSAMSVHPPAPPAQPVPRRPLPHLPAVEDRPPEAAGQVAPLRGSRRQPRREERLPRVRAAPAAAGEPPRDPGPRGDAPRRRQGHPADGRAVPRLGQLREEEERAQVRVDAPHAPRARRRPRRGRNRRGPRLRHRPRTASRAAPRFLFLFVRASRLRRRPRRAGS